MTEVLWNPFYRLVVAAFIMPILLISGIVKFDLEMICIVPWLPFSALFTKQRLTFHFFGKELIA